MSNVRIEITWEDGHSSLIDCYEKNGVEDIDKAIKQLEEIKTRKAPNPKFTKGQNLFIVSSPGILKCQIEESKVLWGKIHYNIAVCQPSREWHWITYDGDIEEFLFPTITEAAEYYKEHFQKD